MPHYNDPNAASFDKQCTPKRCAPHAISADAKRCSKCDELRCPECLLPILLGGEAYCRNCAKCGHITDINAEYPTQVDLCGALAIDACQDCGTLVCSEHAAKDPENSRCLDCASDAREAAINQDAMALEDYRAVEAQSSW